MAVASGIASVWFSRRESLLTYPTGLTGSILYIYLSLRVHLPGEATVNLYYTIMSIYGWYWWARRDRNHEKILHITWSDQAMWWKQILFFLFFYLGFWVSLTWLKPYFNESIPWADSFASATAFTGMWLMTRKKVESWYWWIATNVVSIPLYFIKGLVVTSVYYLVLLLLAFWGLNSWRKKAG
ncbi:MAG: nicotinamide riboside transporter PnuC [Chitinophagaceae bacterium]